MNSRFFRRISESLVFHWAVITIIFINATLIAVQITKPSQTVNLIQHGCIGFFILEIMIRFVGSTSVRGYFADWWNIFDIVLVGIGLLPTSLLGEATSYASAFRVLRVLRVLRLVEAFSELKVIIGVLLRSLKSLVAIGFLLVVFMYLFALIGVQLFEGKTEARTPQSAPDPYGSVPEAMFTLLRIMTGEDWTDIRYGLVGDEEGSALGVISTVYHTVWVVLSAFILLNLVLGAIVHNYYSIKTEYLKPCRRPGG